MPKPEISVVMSVFNDARYLRGALESILSQDGADFEFVIVNDGSTDGSPAILAEFAARDPRVRIINQENSGLTKALIRGCAEARGAFIARQDGDDISVAGRLSILRDMLQSDPGLAFVSSWGEVIGPEDEPLFVHRRPAGVDEATRQLLYDRVGPPGHGSVMFRKSCYDQVGGYRPQFYYAQDSDLWLRLGLVGKLDYAQQVLYRYRISEASISGAFHHAKLPFARLIDELHAVRMAGENEEPILARAPCVNPDKKTVRPSSEDMTLYFIGRCLYERRDRRALKYLYRSVRSNPGKLKAWALLLAASPLLLRK